MMTVMRVFAFWFLCLLAPATAAPSSLDSLFASLKSAATTEDAQGIERQILSRFARSGSDSIDLLLARADEAHQAGQAAVAGDLLKAVTEIAPRFAEGWRARALILVEAGDDRTALTFLQKTVTLNPRHFAALVELGGLLEVYGSKDGALKYYRQALGIDPQFEGLAQKVDALARNVEGQGI